MSFSQEPPRQQESTSHLQEQQQQPEAKQEEQLQTNITTPHNNDVLCGRGGVVNAHPGNEQYREIVERKKRVYLTARFKREKRLIASSIVEEVRNLNPPGRFLMKDPVRNVWHEIGYEKARDKTSQALRENALNLRKQMEEENQEMRRLRQREEHEEQGSSSIGFAKDVSNANISPGAATVSFYGHSNETQNQQQSVERIAPTSWGFMSQQPQLHYPYTFMPTAPIPDQQHRQLPVAPYYEGGALPLHPPPTHRQFPQYISNIQSQDQQQQQQQSISHPITLPPRIMPLNATHTSTGIAEQIITMPPAPIPSTTAGHSSTTNPPLAPATNDDYLPSTRTGPPSTNRRSSLSSSRDSSPGDRHVQFENDTITSTSDRVPPPHSHHPTNRVPPPVFAGTSTSSSLSTMPTTIPGHESTSPPRSPTNTIGSRLSETTPATPLAFLSGDFFSVKTSDSLSYYLKELEDEISGDVGQEVELVAHAPMFYQSSVEGGESYQYDSLQEQEHQLQQPQQQHRSRDPLHAHHSRHHGGIPSYTRSTPRRSGDRSDNDQKSGSGSGRRRKRHVGTHVPSNSGKIQLDLSTLGRVGGAVSSAGEGGSIRSKQKEPHPPPSALPCGDVFTSPMRRTGSAPNRTQMSCAAGSINSAGNLNSTPTSPVFSLDFDKMSLCGTENVSQMGGSLGGASLCHVFDDHEVDSTVGATLMDMTVSVGSHPSGGRSSGSSNYSPQSGLGLHHPGNTQSMFSDNESLIGLSSAIMEFSVDSGTAQNREPGNADTGHDNESCTGASSTGAMDMSIGSNTHSKIDRTGSSQNSSSGSGSGGSLSRGSRRSGSPASIDKASLSLCEDGGRASLSE